MSRIKVNVANGGVIEKPLVTCFQGNGGNYIVLDNEANGSMGLPIICISKFDGSKLIKILDQNEWNSVKECLKTIISGKNLPYLNVPETVTAGDDFYTQLTLPIASFDLLKSVYSPAALEEPKAEVKEEAPAATPETPAPEAAPSVSEVPAMEAPATLGSIEVGTPTPASEPAAPAMPEAAPVAPAMPDLPPVPEIPAIPAIPGVGEMPTAEVVPTASVTSEAVSAPVEAAPAVPETPIMPEITVPEITPEAPAATPETPAPEAAPVVDMGMAVPTVNTAPDVTPVETSEPAIIAEPLPDDPLAMMVPDPNVTEAPVAPVENADPITMPTTEMVENTLVGESDDIAALKENFMKSCETMFDALIKKFENKKNE